MTAEGRRRSSFIADLRAVLGVRDFRQLFAVRLVSQTGDGVFTAGVGTYVFFNASTFPNPASGAAAFAVLYLPYSLIGPFAGVLIDRWSRRQILALSALIRSAFVVLTAVLMAAGNRGVPLYIAVLLVLGVNRFFLSSLSAALPHVVADDKLVMANSVSPTLGGLMASVGGVLALGLNAVTGDSERGAASTVLVTGCCYVIASLIAVTIARDRLGPASVSSATRLRTELGVVAAGLADGARYVARRREVASALGVTGGYRLMYGALFLMSILLYRNYYYPSKVTTAEGHFVVLVIVTAIGYGCAALVTPPVTRRISKQAWILALAAASALVTGVLGETFQQALYLVIGFCLGLAGQGVAICATTILQQEADDAYRGRMFAFYDMTFNITYAGGAALSVLFMSVTGHSPVLVAIVGAGFAVSALGYWLAVFRPHDPAGGVMPSAAAQRSSS
ncbi:MAG TPA: MFS transporter [Streptosporangiaceae bacterium]